MVSCGKENTSTSPLSLWVVLLLCFLCVYPHIIPAEEMGKSANHRELELSILEIDWLRENQEITIYTDEELFPYSFVKDDSTAGGVVVDVANAMGKRLGVTINVIPVHYQTLVSLMEKDTVHGVAMVDPGDYPDNAPFLKVEALCMWLWLKPA